MSESRALLRNSPVNQDAVLMVGGSVPWNRSCFAKGKVVVFGSTSIYHFDYDYDFENNTTVCTCK